MFELVVLLALAQEPALESRLARALERLRSDDFEDREAASKELEALPAEALALMEAALKKPDLDAESRMRLERALPRLRMKSGRLILRKKREAYESWTRRTVVEAYEKAGRKNEAWDAAARDAVAGAAEQWAADAGGATAAARKAYEHSQEALRAGCDDPLVRYIHARMYDTVVRKDYAEAVRLHLEAARGMKELGAGYPPIRQTFVFGRAAEFLGRSKKELSEADRKDVQEWIDLAHARLAQAARDAEVPDPTLLDSAEVLIDAEMRLTRDRKTGFDKAHAALSEARPKGAAAHILKGRVYVPYAWDARGSGYANTVTEDGWRKMAARLAEAEAALVRAWEIDPSDPEPATLMIGVELGQPKGRPVMELWYRRAMEANPDNVDACKKKMYYLEPKWHGSAEDMLAFGRELLAGGNWDARLPFQLIDAHVTLAGYEKTPPDYYKKADVWKDVKSVYDGILAREPGSAHFRSWYAKLSCWCGEWAEAQRQFERLGAKVDVSVFKDRAELDKLKAEAAQKGR